MPSPIIHLTAGYAVYSVASHVTARPRPDPVLLGAAMGLALLPDFDSALGILFGDFGRFHNSQSHSLIVGAGVALATGLLLLAVGHRRPALWFAVTLACYELHILLDYFTWGRGVMAWWPLTDERFSSPALLFYGLHWSQGFVSSRHLVTLLTEMPVAIAMLTAVRMWSRRGVHLMARQRSTG
jgi:inner membrane protein